MKDLLLSRAYFLVTDAHECVEFHILVHSHVRYPPPLIALICVYTEGPRNSYIVRPSPVVGPASLIHDLQTHLRLHQVSSRFIAIHRIFLGSLEA